MNSPIIRTPRQRRAIAALVKYGRVSSRELGKLAGVLNPPELMAALGRNGWKWRCELIEVLDGDGKICRPGLYSLLQESLEIAKKMVGAG
ncbi:hypothetical protein [Methylobacter sp.]|uniref:hypothetical protein n=1 Tax=Methylobacter sp. TaxID=2051955 RepID=UPI002488179E|nr:hypothetical protein [Methylobacter sp.]MDI1277296.1 hypothetical protein [Methylobacter sp.]MDI1357862.1 hypothetical protein [Methylobacter sp.]